MIKVRLVQLGGCLILAALTGTAMADCNSALKKSTPDSHFVVKSGGMVLDKTTGLMWQRCAKGYAWQGGTCVNQSDVQQQITWQQALTASVDESFGGFNDWRLPNKKELESIVERSCFQPSINQTIFPGTPSALFWSSTPSASRPEATWVVNFESGAHRSLVKSEWGAVRFVRDYTE